MFVVDVVPDDVVAADDGSVDAFVVEAATGRACAGTLCVSVPPIGAWPTSSSRYEAGPAGNF